MKRSSYWYIRLLTGHEARPLFVGLVAGASLLLIFIIWIAIIDWLGGNTHLSVSRLVLEVFFVGLASYAIAVTSIRLR